MGVATSRICLADASFMMVNSVPSTITDRRAVGYIQPYSTRIKER